MFVGKYAERLLTVNYNSNCENYIFFSPIYKQLVSSYPKLQCITFAWLMHRSSCGLWHMTQ